MKKNYNKIRSLQLYSIDKEICEANLYLKIKNQRNSLGSLL